MDHAQLVSITHFVGGVRELVRGQEQEFISRLRPLVEVHSICLDLSWIERIDAAGLAALISLCREARETGHEFTVVNPSRQAARILALVGIDRVLLADDLGTTLLPAPTPDLVAA